jgi:hypothetical protein
MKTALKHINDEFLVMPLKHILSITDLVNHSRTSKLWAISHKMALKCKNDEFLVMPLKHVLCVMDLVNHTGIQKLWAIAHKKWP